MSETICIGIEKFEAPMSPKSIAVDASTIGYCTDMRLPHVRQRPRNATHDATGMRSNHRSGAPHERHPDLPPIVRAPRRKITTLRKLPMTRPKRPYKTAIMLF